MSKIYLNPSGVLENLKNKIVEEVKNSEGIDNSELSSKLGIDTGLLDSLIRELSEEGKLKIYV